MSVSKHHIVRVRGDKRQEIDDSLAVEEPLEIRLHYTDALKGPAHKTLSITMRTPGNDDELALGFLFTEGIIATADQVSNVEQVNDNVVRVVVNPEVSLDLSRLERHFYTTSSCGICGKASLEALSISGADVLDDNQFSVSRAALSSLSANLRNHQPLFSKTGGNHGVALFNQQGDILAVREDVGRHNAMDKLIGCQLRMGQVPLKDQGILVSGRASFELMQKALMAGSPMLVAVGAPSSLAVELAEEFNITLIGFLSEDGYNLYHGNEPGPHYS